MSEFIPAHFIDDFAFSVDEQCPLHVGASRDDGIMNTHSPQNLQRCPSCVDLVAPCQQRWCPLDDGRSKPIAAQPIGTREPRDTCARNQYSHLLLVVPPPGKRVKFARRISGDLKLSEQ